MTLETAKQLKEAGWSVETEWGYCGVTPEYVTITRKSLLNPLEFERMFYPCPSLEELLAVMPCYTKLNNEYYFNLCKSIDNKRYYAEYRDNSQDVMMFKDELLQTTDPDPSEAVAQLWLKLRKEGIV